jgi:hypothetical protein
MNRLIFTITLFFIAVAAMGQIAIVAAVDKNPVSINETFELKFTIINHSTRALIPPLFSGFEVLSGPNSAENTTLQNGVKSVSGALIYTLKPNHTGSFTIGKATLVEDGKTYTSDELTVVVTQQKVASGNTKDIFFEEPISTRSSDSLYFKDGTVVGDKATLIQDCVKGMGKKKKKDLNVNNNNACSCMLETIAKHYSYEEYLKSSEKNEADLFTRSQTENPQAYKEMLNCILENMSEKEKQTQGKAKTQEKTTANLSEQDYVESFFLDACVKEAAKTKEYKQMNIDAELYCQCTWDKIKEKGISLDKLNLLGDQNSPLFNEIITPCIMSSIKKEGATGSTNNTKNSEDIIGTNNSETIPLTKLLNVYKLKVSFGSIEKYFTLDSGANDVFINGDLERELLLDGLIKKSDYLSTHPYRMADGTMVDCRRIKLNNITIGGYTINNVIVAISDKSAGMLLLGKSLLDKFSDWKIDNKKEELILSR